MVIAAGPTSIPASGYVIAAIQPLLAALLSAVFLLKLRTRGAAFSWNAGILLAVASLLLLTAIFWESGEVAMKLVLSPAPIWFFCCTEIVALASQATEVKWYHALGGLVAAILPILAFVAAFLLLWL